VPEIARALDELLASLLHRRSAALRIAPQFTMVHRLDGPLVFRVHETSGRPRAVVLCSPRDAPDIVQRGIDCARAARQAMTAAEARHVLDPLAVGRVEGLSYAVMPYCAELAGGRIAWVLQRHWLAPALFDWLWRVHAATVRDTPADEQEERFGQALARLAMDQRLSASVQAAAQRAAGRLRTGRWHAKTVLMHGDRWKANILLRPSSNLFDAGSLRGRFVVIDWPASSVKGHAIYDLVRLALSMRMADQALRREIDRHCAILQCASEDTMSYLLAACGHFASDLEHFPVEQFVPMVESCHAALERALGAHAG
jgi:aminoglycoside phosphotransferase (APT) family kinase protein